MGLKPKSIFTLCFIIASSIVILTVYLEGAQVQEGKGVITGKLVYAVTNKPAASINLLAIRVVVDSKTKKVTFNIFVVKGDFPKTTTDAQGKFSIKNLPVGKFALSASESPLDKGNLLTDELGNIRVFEIKKDDQVIDIGTVNVK